MKNDPPKTNYLAGAKSSDYDVFQRRISALIQHWMDHTSGIKPSNVIAQLCNAIDKSDFLFITCDEENLFSTKSDYFLGLIIGFFIEIQDGVGEKLEEKRIEIEIVLRQFSLLSHNAKGDRINLRGINQPTDQPTKNDATNQSTKMNWWLKFIDFFTKER